jgi:hypothetical protein
MAKLQALDLVGKRGAARATYYVLKTSESVPWIRNQSATASDSIRNRTTGSHSRSIRNLSATDRLPMLPMATAIITTITTISTGTSSIASNSREKARKQYGWNPQHSPDASFRWGSRGISMSLIAVWGVIFRILFHLLLVDVLDGKKGKVWAIEIKSSQKASPFV